MTIMVKAYSSLKAANRLARSYAPSSEEASPPQKSARTVKRAAVGNRRCSGV